MLRRAALVPIAFVHADLFAALNRNSSVGEKIRRVGKDGVDGIVGDLRNNVDAVGKVESEVWKCMHFSQ